MPAHGFVFELPHVANRIRANDFRVMLKAESKDVADDFQDLIGGRFCGGLPVAKYTNRLCIHFRERHVAEPMRRTGINGLLPCPLKCPSPRINSAAL